MSIKNQVKKESDKGQQSIDNEILYQYFFN